MTVLRDYRRQPVERIVDPLLRGILVEMDRRLDEVLSALMVTLPSAGAGSFSSLLLNGSTSGVLTLRAAAITSPHTLTFPAAQGAAGAALFNNGSGALAWTPAGRLASDQTWLGVNTFGDGTGFLVLMDPDDPSFNPLEISDGTSGTILLRIDPFLFEVQMGAFSLWPSADVGVGSKGSFVTVALSADRTYTFPNVSGTAALLTAIQTLTQSTLGTGCVLIASTASSGVSFSHTADLTKKLRMVLSGAIGNNSLTLTNTAARNYGLGNLSGNVVIVGDDPPAVASGSLGKVDLTAQNANIGTTNLSSTPPAGLYAVEVYIATTTADVTAGTLAVVIGWTDAVGATTANAVAAHTLAATGRSTGRQLVQVASGDITYAVTVTGAYGTSAYAVYVRVVALG